MRLIFIRHAEPDYENNTLTERGFREAELLAERVPNWTVERFYSSPLKRALLTAEPSMKKMNRSLETLDWMKEFSYAIHDPTTGRRQIPWDFMPQYWTNEPLLLDRNDFWQHPILQSAQGYEPAVHALRKGMDALLAEFGYFRQDNYYYTDDARTMGDDDRTVVIFAHLGANCEAMGYLLGISPVVLKQTIYLAPTSVSILNADKRQPGAPEGWNPARPDSGFPGIAAFRAQVIGDATHLLDAGQPISPSGAFSEIFSG